MSNSTTIRFVSRYTDIEYTAYRDNLDNKISYLGTNFDSIKDWIKVIYRQEEIIACSFIANNISDTNVIEKIDHQLLNRSKKLEISSDIDHKTVNYLSKYIKSSIPLATSETINESDFDEFNF